MLLLLLLRLSPLLSLAFVSEYKYQIPAKKKQLLLLPLPMLPRYLPTFNRPNVELVHDPAGIEAFTEKGVVSGGKEYEVSDEVG